MEFYLEQSQLGASTGMETGTFPTHCFGPNLKWQVCFAQLKHGEPQLLKDRHLQTDPVTAAPQPIKLQETYMANTTQDTASTGQLPWAPGKTACWDLALLMYCSGDILSQLLQSQQRADAIPVLGGFKNSLEHLGMWQLTDIVCLWTTQRAWHRWHGGCTSLPVCSHTK